MPKKPKQSKTHKVKSSSDAFLGHIFLFKKQIGHLIAREGQPLPILAILFTYQGIA